MQATIEPGMGMFSFDSLCAIVDGFVATLREGWTLSHFFSKVNACAIEIKFDFCFSVHSFTNATIENNTFFAH